MALKTKKNYVEPRIQQFMIISSQIICTSGESGPQSNKVEDLTYTDEEWYLTQ